LGWVGFAVADLRFAIEEGGVLYSLSLTAGLDFQN
jgi:hypothetical protein